MISVMQSLTRVAAFRTIALVSSYAIVVSFLIGAQCPRAPLDTGLAPEADRMAAGEEFVRRGHVESVRDTTCFFLAASTDSALAVFRESRTASDSAAWQSLSQQLDLCANAADSVARWSSLALARPEMLRLARLSFEVPEYHDEGRLPIGGDALGPYAGIFASPLMSGFTRRGQIYEHGRPGVLAAVVTVQRDDRSAPLPDAYRALNLDYGLNCVWLHLPAPTGDYVSYVSPGTAAGCDRTKVPSNLAPLPVAVHSPGGPHGDYPAAARFDTDRTGRLVLGFKCLNAWCEAGTVNDRRRGPWTTYARDEDAGSDGRPLQTREPEAGGKRVRQVKGWHDEQYLAVRDRQGYWRRTNIRASLVPDTRVAAYDKADFMNRWVRVATIEIHGDLPSDSKYYRWGLRTGRNQLWMRYDGTSWAGQLRRRGEPAVPWRIIEGHKHYDVPVPAITRFRWTNRDEGAWAPCGTSCCKGDGEGGT